MNSIRIKLGFAALAVVVIFVFQNCSSSSFSPIASSEGDVTDPVRLNNAKCEYDGKEYWHGETIKTFSQSSVAYDKVCEQQTHTCDNGTFTGQIGFKDCGVGVARDCQIGADTIKHNAEVTRFESGSVAYNESCRSEVRRCTDGTIPGTYIVKNCLPAQPPQALDVFKCQMREGQIEQKVEDLYQKWSDGTYKKVETCSNWHITRDNASWNCGKIMRGIYGAGAPTAAQPSCCPQDYTVTNGICHPIAQRGEACFGPLDCADGLECDTDRTSDSTPYDRTCQ